MMKSTYGFQCAGNNRVGFFEVQFIFIFVLACHCVVRSFHMPPKSMIRAQRTNRIKTNHFTCTHIYMRFMEQYCVCYCSY